MLDTVTDAFLDDLNACVTTASTMPRVRFEVGLGAEAENWLKKKHADGAVHEPGTIAAFLAVAKHYECLNMWDMGALFGYFALLSVMLFENAEVTAFEMHPAVIKPLAINVAPSVTCVYAVVSDVPRPAQHFWISGFNIFEKPTGGWDALPNIPGAMKARGENNRGAGFGKAGFITIDSHAAATKAPDLIKIDVEGYQAKAILGGLETFRTKKPIVIIELHDPEKLARFGTSNKATVQPLFDLGYKGYWCGNFRDKDARFEAVNEMTEQHEKLSIMVLVP